MVGEILAADKIMKIGQRVEFDAEEGNGKYTSRIEDILPEQLIVAMPVDDKRRPVLPQPGTKLLGRIIVDKCVYRFFAVYQERKADPIPVWYISRPNILERWQRRQFVRIEAKLPVQVQIINEEGQLGETLDTLTVDVSGNGLCFVHQQMVPIGSRVILNMKQLPKIGDLQVTAAVARCIPKDLEKQRIYYIGVEFKDMEKVVQNKFIHFIFELQRKHLMIMKRSE